MPNFDATTFLDVVDELLTAPGVNSPARIRSAANRIYYSQYAYLRRLIVETHGDCFKVGVKSAGKHGQLYKCCIKSASDHIRRIGKRLERLCLLREKADYTWGETDEPTLSEVQTARETALSLKQKISNLSKTDLMEIYRGLK